MDKKELGNNNPELDGKMSVFREERVEYVETSQVKEGVRCDVYNFTNTTEKDLGIITVDSACTTPWQKVLKGDKTLEIFLEGEGSLIIVGHDNQQVEYKYPGGPKEVEVKVGELMQWRAKEKLIFAEICYPPYEEGRFQNINNKEK